MATRGTGVAAALRGRADIVTLLREPADQIISNFLFIRTDPNNPDSAPARARLGSGGFSRRILITQCSKLLRCTLD